MIISHHFQGFFLPVDYRSEALRRIQTDNLLLATARDQLDHQLNPVLGSGQLSSMTTPSGHSIGNSTGSSLSLSTKLNS